MRDKHRGAQGYRFKDNPEERRFSDAWSEQNKYHRTLDYLFTDPVLLSNNGNHPVETPPNECELVATVIQWLGSPVGQNFLSELGYEKKT